MGLLVVTLGHVTVSRCQITSLVPTATFLDPAVIQKVFFFLELPYFPRTICWYFSTLNGFDHTSLRKALFTS